MELKVRNTSGEVVGSLQVREDVFDSPMNSSLVHQVMVGQLANTRQGTASTKTRSHVSGSSRKVAPQKHSGRARRGSIRSPVNRGGGVVFGPHPRGFRHRTPRRMRRQSLVAVLSDKVREDELLVLDELNLEEPTTKRMAQVLDALKAGPSVLLVADGADPTSLRSARNIPRLTMLPASLLNTLDLLKHRKVVMTTQAVRRAEELWGGPLERRKKEAPEAAEA